MIDLAERQQLRQAARGVERERAVVAEERLAVRGHEQDVPVAASSRAPSRRARATSCAARGRLRRGHQVHLGMLLVAADEREPLAVGRQARRRRLAQSGGQPPRGAAVGAQRSTGRRRRRRRSCRRGGWGGAGNLARTWRSFPWEFDRARSGSPRGGLRRDCSERAMLAEGPPACPSRTTSRRGGLTSDDALRRACAGPARRADASPWPSAWREPAARSALRRSASRGTRWPPATACAGPCAATTR